MHFFGAQPDHVDGKTSMFLFTQVNKRWITHLSIVSLSWWTEGPSFSTQVKICQRNEPGIWYSFPQRPHEIHELHLRFCFPVSNTKLGHGGNLNGKMEWQNLWAKAWNMIVVSWKGLAWVLKAFIFLHRESSVLTVFFPGGIAYVYKVKLIPSPGKTQSEVIFMK